MLGGVATESDTDIAWPAWLFPFFPEVPELFPEFPELPGWQYFDFRKTRSPSFDALFLLSDIFFVPKKFFPVNIPELPEIEEPLCSSFRRYYPGFGAYISGTSGDPGVVIWWRFRDRQGLIAAKSLL